MGIDLFFIKKLISAFFMPFPLGLALLFIGFLYLHFKKYTKAKIFISFSLLWFMALSYQPVVNRLLIPLEYRYEALKEIPKDIKHIVVLGNGHTSNDSLSITSQLNSTAINRFSEAFRIYKKLDGAKLIFTGYGGRDKNSHAFMQKQLALSFGVKKEDIIYFPTPRDTKEEAKVIKEYLKDKKFILVTSASHMPRSIYLFENEGIKPLPAPTNHLAADKGSFYSRLSAYNLYKAKIAFHEYLGLLWFKTSSFYEKNVKKYLR